MKVYRAETGQQVNWQPQTNVETFQDFQQELESCTGVSADNQIIMTSYGTQVKQANVKEVVEATGQKEYLVFFFDRQYLEALPEDTVALLDAETPTLEPKIGLFDESAQLKALQNISSRQSLGQNCKQLLSLFAYFDSYSQTLIGAVSTHTELAKTIVESQKMQSMALNVALTNLETHNVNTSKNVEQFIYLAEKELVRQTDLINSIHNDLGILRNIKIHPSILPLMDQALTTFQDKGKEENITRSGGGERLVDFIDEAAVGMLKSETVAFCNHSSQNIRDLQNMVKNLQVCEKELQQHVVSSTNLQALDASLADIQDLNKKSQYLRERIKRDLTRVYNKIADLLQVPISSLFSSTTIMPQTSSDDANRSLKRVADLAKIHITDYLPKLSEYESEIRQRITDLTISKRRSIQHFIDNMHTISFLQNDIAEVMPKLGAAENYMNQFKEINGENGLENARKILFAYGALMIEIVRRNEYIALLIENANLFADIFARYRDQEEERRGYFRHEVHQLLPFKLAVLDKVSPQCDITTTARDDDESFKLRKKDIIDFISLLTQAYAQSPQSTPSSPKTASRRLINNKRLSSPTSLTIRDSSTSSRRVTATEHPDNKLLSLLNNMNHQLNGLREEFLKALESSFFPGTGLSESRLSFKDQSYFRSDKDTESILLQKSMAEDQLKAYKARITSLERTLRNTIRTNENNRTKQINDTVDTTSELQNKKKIADLEAENKSQSLELDKLKEYIQELEEEKSTWEHEKTAFEQEKEELEQMLEDERHTFEHNRQSLLNEAKIKDNLADLRIATAEEDWRGKMDDLQHALEEETRMRQNLEIEHTSEIETITHECKEQVEELNTLLAKVKEQATKGSRFDTLAKEKQELEKEMVGLQTSLEKLQDDYNALNQEIATERLDYEKKVSQLQTKIIDSEKARDEIKSLQAQTRGMVNKAQEDWVAKNEELQSIKREHESVRVAIGDLLARYMGDTELISQENDLEAVIQIFQQNLDSFTIRSNMTRQNLEAMEMDFEDMSQNYKDLLEEHNEWRSIASRMAEKMEEYRKNFMFELINHLQLAVDEDEINALSKKITLSDDDAAIWNEIIQISSTIDTQKMVIRLRKRFKELHDSAKQYKRDYKELKEKYSKLSYSFTEKIAFRNFKVGDVALFLPTRNSSGKPWAAFNINAPHYFLKPTEYVLSQMTKEWIVARIVSITEHVTDANIPESNPYGLANNLTYYQLTVENWKNHRNGSSKRRSKEQGISSSVSIAEPVVVGMNRKNNYTAASGVKLDSGLASITSPSTSPPETVTTPTAALSQKRPGYPLSISSSNIVHSYANSSSSNPFSEDERRRRSIDMIKTKE